MFSALTMLYASYVLKGKWDINNVPPLIRADVQAIIDEATKKPEDEDTTTPEPSF